ncbi:MAG TPA: HD domain-containing phosphohydrolase [Anaerolineae bacterium]
MTAYTNQKHQVNPPPPITNPEPAGGPESIIVHHPEEDLRQRYADLSALYVAGARLSAILEWEPLIRELLQIAIQLVHGDSASLMVIDEHRGDLYIEAATHLSPSIITATRLKIDEGVAGWVAGHREAVLLVGTVEADRFVKFHPKPDAIGSSMSVPLIPPFVAGKLQNVLGVLNIHRLPGRAPLTSEDLELVTALSTQAAAALQNARLYKQLHRSNIQLQNLNDIGRNLTRMLDVDAVLHSIMEKAVELLNCEAGSVLTVEESGDLIFRVALGPAGPKLINTRLPAGMGIAGSVFQTGKPLIVNDVQTDPRHFRDENVAAMLPTRSLLCVPLTNNSRVTGVLEVINKTDGSPFDEDDRDSLAAFATQGSIALENARLYSDLKRAFTDTVRVIANAIEARDPYTAGHAERVTSVAIETAREMGWSREQIELLEIGSLLHDIGKIGVSDAILRKPDRLTDEEYGQMKKHPVVGAKMLESVSILRSVLPYILYHQERYDGQGYPFGLSGKEIPIEGRILAVLDTLDAMTSDRPYRKGQTVEQALAEIKRHRGTQFDPEIVDALLRVAERISLQSLLTPSSVSS